MLLPRTREGSIHLDVVALVHWGGLLRHRHHRRVWRGALVVDELHTQPDLHLSDAQVLGLPEGKQCSRKLRTLNNKGILVLAQQ